MYLTTRAGMASCWYGIMLVWHHVGMASCCIGLFEITALIVGYVEIEGWGALCPTLLCLYPSYDMVSKHGQGILNEA